MTNPLLVLLVVSPVLLYLLVYTVVAIVALCQAKSEDVPAILKECSGVFGRVADRLLRLRLGGPVRSAITPDSSTGQLNRGVEGRTSVTDDSSEGRGL